MKKIIIIAVVMLCSVGENFAQVYTVKNTVAVSVNGGYIQDGAIMGLEVSYYVCNKPLYLFAGGYYTFRKPFEDNKQNDLLFNIGAGWTVPLKAEKGWSLSPFLGVAYDKVSVDNVKLDLESQFNFGIVYGVQVEKSFRNTWSIGLFGKQFNMLTGGVKINDFFCGISVKKAFNTFRYNK